jgi:transcriptional regulator with XRE-family HTH domain
MKEIDAFSTIIDQIKENLKINKNVKNEEFAENCGLTPQALANIINGDTKNPGVRIIYNLLKNYRVNPNFFFFENQPMFFDETNISSQNPLVSKILQEKCDDLERQLIERNIELLRLYREKDNLEKELKRKAG